MIAELAVKVTLSYLLGSVVGAGGTNALRTRGRGFAFLVARVLGVVSFATILCGCTPNHLAFEKAVRQRVSVGMTLSTAVSSLAKMHMDCYGGYQVSCTRNRSGPMLSGCIERVNLHVSQDNTFIDSIEVPPIACVGL